MMVRRSAPQLGVAPPAGAWIETGRDSLYIAPGCVAPPAGAWIETDWKDCIVSCEDVAPPAGAWIET